MDSDPSDPPSVLRVFVARKHPHCGAFVSQTKPRKLCSTLREESFVSVPHPERGGLSYRVAELCMRHGFFPRPVRATSRKTTQLSLVAAGFGVAILPAITREIAPASVRFVPLAGADNSTTIAMLYRADASALVDGFSGALRLGARSVLAPGVA